MDEEKVANAPLEEDSEIKTRTRVKLKEVIPYSKISSIEPYIIVIKAYRNRYEALKRPLLKYTDFEGHNQQIHRERGERIFGIHRISRIC